MPYPASRAVIAIVVAAFASGCDDEPRPWSAPPVDRRLEAPGPVLPAEGAPSLLGDAGFLDPAEPEAEAPIPTPARPVGGLWARCHEGFRPSGDPAADATRLATACGPANGMVRQGGLRRGEVRPDRVTRIELVPEAGHCYRVFATGDAAVRGLSLSLRRGSRVLAEQNGDRYAILEAERPVCPATTEPLTITASATTRGHYAAEIWALER